MGHAVLRMGICTLSLLIRASYAVFLVRFLPEFNICRVLALVFIVPIGVIAAALPFQTRTLGLPSSRS